MYGCGIFTDLKTAFDTVNHIILLNKFERYGTRGRGWKWFTSYLSNISQYVSNNNTTTQNISLVEFLKGQYLDHYYFCYILMIYQIFLISIIFLLFADDTNIYFEANNLDKIQEVMNKGLKLLS